MSFTGEQLQDEAQGPDECHHPHVGLCRAGEVSRGRCSGLPVSALGHVKSA